jgi:hypothetical protein
MKTMKPTEKEYETEKLTHILSQLQNVYYKKKEQLDELNLEVTELLTAINDLKSLISDKSFSSADELYSDLKQNEIQTPYTDYFKEGLPEEKFKGTSIKRKIFSSDKHNENDLLCVLNLIDRKMVEIKFIDPGKSAIIETSEDFINIFLKGALIKIKEEGNPNLSVSYKLFKNTEKIEKIYLSNLTSIKEYDLITEKIHELLTCKKINS